MAEQTPPIDEPNFADAEDALLRDLADSGGVAETATETERTRFVDPLQTMKAIELSRKLNGIQAPRQRSRLGTTCLAYRSTRRGW